jgi:hypothetical protein
MFLLEKIDVRKIKIRIDKRIYKICGILYIIIIE